VPGFLIGIHGSEVNLGAISYNLSAFKVIRLYSCHSFLYIFYFSIKPKNLALNYSFPIKLPLLILISSQKYLC